MGKVERRNELERRQRFRAGTSKGSEGGEFDGVPTSVTATGRDIDAARELPAAGESGRVRADRKLPEMPSMEVYEPNKPTLDHLDRKLCHPFYLRDIFSKTASLSENTA
jgi:hypothetical protein